MHKAVFFCLLSVVCTHPAFANDVGVDGTTSAAQPTASATPRILRAEIMPAPPRPANKYRWQPGHWDKSTPEHARWVKGHYVLRDGE